jgi:hypothetical protein
MPRAATKKTNDPVDIDEVATDGASQAAAKGAPVKNKTTKGANKTPQAHPPNGTNDTNGTSKTKQHMHVDVGLNIPPSRVSALVRDHFREEGEESKRISQDTPFAVAAAVDWAINGATQHACAQAGDGSMVEVKHLHEGELAGQAWYALFAPLQTYADYTPEREQQLKQEQSEKEKQIREERKKRKERKEKGEEVNDDAAADDEQHETTKNLHTHANKVVDQAKEQYKSSSGKERLRISTRFRQVIGECARELVLRVARSALHALQTVVAKNTFTCQLAKSQITSYLQDQSVDSAPLEQWIQEKLDARKKLEKEKEARRQAKRQEEKSPEQLKEEKQKDEQKAQEKKQKEFERVKQRLSELKNRFLELKKELGQ